MGISLVQLTLGHPRMGRSFRNANQALTLVGAGHPTGMMLPVDTFNLAAGAFFAAVGLLLALNIRNCAGWLADHSRFSVFFRPPREKRAPFIRGIGWVWLVGGSLVIVVALFR